MRTALEGARRGAPARELASREKSSNALSDKITLWLDEAKAEDIVEIDLRGKSSIGDTMLIATGRSDRHVGAIADQIQKKLKELGLTRVRIEGMEACDWVLIDAGDIIVHVFRAEVRDFYNLEKMWTGERPADAASH